MKMGIMRPFQRTLRLSFLILRTVIISTTFHINAENIMAQIPDREAVLESNLIITYAESAGRQTMFLDGSWDIIIDPYQVGYYTYRYEPNPIGFFLNRRNVEPGDAWEYDFEQSEKLHVPGDWNTQMEKLHWYEGTIWYKKDFTWRPDPEKRVFLYFGGVNYDARVWVNGEKAGRHIGGFTPFSFEVTDLLTEGENFVVVMVDNTRRPEAVPTVNTDWFNYGGITRSVRLIETPRSFIQDFFAQLAKSSRNRIEGWVRINGEPAVQNVTVRISEAGTETRVRTDADGFARFSFEADLKLWSPANPHRYDVEIVSQTDSITDTIGFRSIETDRYEILLNGEPIFLRGISIHEEAPYRTGRANNIEDARILLDWVEELGCNYIRLSHYPHNEHMVREAERRGLLIWSEIPVYWTIQWGNPETLDNALKQLSEMIHRDKNRTAVILWSVSNEAPISDERIQFLRALVERARDLDPTRLITAALERHTDPNRPDTFIIDDPVGEYLDVVGVNQYHGWYGGSHGPMDHLKWEMNYEKPLIMSEFGGGALQGWRAGIEQRWSEDYQEYLYINTLNMLSRVEFLRGTSPWILMDFRSPRRQLPGIKNGFNRKGLVSDQGLKKRAFYVMKEWYKEKAREWDKR
jgi:beta-glucuronidase